MPSSVLLLLGLPTTAAGIEERELKSSAMGRFCLCGLTIDFSVTPVRAIPQSVNFAATINHTSPWLLLLIC
jgi:hypothetical protein